MMSNTPLEGKKVLELGELLAGPFIGTLLGEFGADVIKIERPGRGDLLREFGPIVDGEGLYWVANSRNKKSVVLDLKTEAGREVLADLFACCDVAIDSLRPGVLEGWGLTEDVLETINPRLVVVHATAFGRYGPYSDRGGYDPIAQGFGGLSYVTGAADGPPMRAGGAIPVCDFMTGLTGALGVLLSLYVRDTRSDGAGQSVDVALYDMAFRMTGPLMSHFCLTGEIWSRNGNHSLGGAPTGHFLTADGHWICTSVQNNEQFRRLADLMGKSSWLESKKFASPSSRTKHRDLIGKEFAEWVRTRTRDEVTSAFESAALVIGPINSAEDMADDPQLAARGHVSTQHSKLGKIRVPDVFPKLSHTPGTIRSEAPALGAHTACVLKTELDYSEKKIRSLARDGVIAIADDRLGT